MMCSSLRTLFLITVSITFLSTPSMASNQTQTAGLLGRAEQRRSEYLYDQINTHFEQMSPTLMAETVGYLKAIQRLATRKFYGEFDFKASPGPGNKTVVSISILHPAMDLPFAQVFFEQDILLTAGQARNMYFDLLDSVQEAIRRKRDAKYPRRRKRKIYKRNSSRWKTLPIPYTMHKSLSTDAVAKVRKGIKLWEDNTCLRYKEITKEKGDYVQFFKGQGCYSMIGRVGGRQGISIGEGCESPGVVAHEMGHSLGLWHEQSRPDRDCCIDILTNNIIKSTISNFLKRSLSDIEYLGTSFDVGSVMHYGPTAFTTDWSKNTIQTKKEGFQRTIGQRDKLSFFDIQIINNAYCKKKCSFSLTCYWGGYQHPGACHKCICPEGIGGTYCEKQESSQNGNCGGEMTVKGSWKIISSPGHPSPGYRTNQKCSWVLRAPIGKNIEFEFIDQFQFWCTTTCMDYVEIKNATDLRKTGMRFCCYEAPKETIQSEGNTMVVIFRSTISRDKGFKARFRFFPTNPANTPKPVKRRPTTTTTKRTTTRRTTPRWVRLTTTTRRPAAAWSTWSRWGYCSETCGACGVRTRARRCIRGPCEGGRREYSQCGFDACPTAKKCEVLREKETCVSSYLEHCYQTKLLRFKCSHHACCPPYRNYGNTCKLGSRKRK